MVWNAETPGICWTLRLHEEPKPTPAAAQEPAGGAAPPVISGVGSDFSTHLINPH